MNHWNPTRAPDKAAEMLKLHGRGGALALARRFRVSAELGTERRRFWALVIERLLDVRRTTEQGGEGVHV